MTATDKTFSHCSFKMQVPSPANGDCFFYALHTALNASGLRSQSPRWLRLNLLSHKALQVFQEQNSLSFDELLYFVLLDCSDSERSFIQLEQNPKGIRSLSHALCAYNRNNTPYVWASGAIIAAVISQLKTNKISVRIVNSRQLHSCKNNIQDRLQQNVESESITIFLCYSGSHYEALIL